MATTEYEQLVLSRSGSVLHGWLTGPEHGPLVTLTHGASMDHRVVAAQVPALVAAGYRVLTWDVRGHGRSKPLGEGFSVPIAAEDLRALMRHAGYERAAVVGQSLGGYIGQELAYRDPESVTALAVIGSTCLTRPLSAPARVALRCSPLMFRLWPNQDLRRRIIRGSARTPQAQREALQATQQQSKREFVTVWNGVATCLRDDPGHRFPQPLLLTRGEHDSVGVVAQAMEAWAADTPGACYRIVPDAGHGANHDNPESFNAILLNFLHTHLPTTPEA